MIGAVEWLVLRRYIGRFGRWILLNAVGWGLAVGLAVGIGGGLGRVISGNNNVLAYLTLCAGLGGVIAGIGQWYGLDRVPKGVRFERWIGVSGVCLAVTMMVFLVEVFGFGEAMTKTVMQLLPYLGTSASSVVGTFTLMAIGAILYGALAGLLVVWALTPQELVSAGDGARVGMQD